MGKKHKAADQLIGHYVDAARFQLFTGEIREMFPKIKRLDLRLYALKRFVYIMNDPDKGMDFINDRWVWTGDEVDDWEASTAHDTQQSELKRIIKKFNDDNPGYRLKAGSDHRSLSSQIWGWNHNGGAKTNAEAYLNKMRKEIRRDNEDGSDKYPDLGDLVSETTGMHTFQIATGGDLRVLFATQLMFGTGGVGAMALANWVLHMEKFEGLRNFVDFMKKKHSGKASVTVATPGLSAHGTGRAIDFRVHDKKTGEKLHGAGGAGTWRSSGFAKKLKDAVDVSSHFHGPLKSPDEPWHFYFDAGE